MGLFKNLRKSRVIKSYIKTLPRLLVRDYGKSDQYTPKQVKRTIERNGLSVAYVCFGIAMFADRDAFCQYHQETGEQCDYDAMRCEIGETYFNGFSGFGINDIASVSSDIGGGFDMGSVSDVDSGSGSY